jgi:festuclavine dehydrogenase
MPPASTILLLGGTGKTSSAITPLLLAAHHNVVVASRSGNAPAGTIGTRFDWSDPSTYPKPFEAAKDIKAAFLVAPSAAADVLTPMKEFIEVARSNGVQRFVLLSSSAIEKGGPVMGLVHEYLAELGVEWAVLRPSWFMGTNPAA